MVLEWNGTDIGEICYDAKIKKITLIKYDDDGELIRVYIKPVDPVEKYKSVIADELKPMFGLMKIGTHICNIKGQMYILYRNYPDGKLLNKYPKGDIDELLRYNIQKCFIFKIIMGFCMNLESTVLIVPCEDLLLATTVKDYKINYSNVNNHFGSTLPRTILDKWFDGNWKNVYRMVKTMFHSPRTNSEGEKVNFDSNKYSDKFEKIIREIDKNETFWAVEITDRIKHFFLV